MAWAGGAAAAGDRSVARPLRRARRRAGGAAGCPRRGAGLVPPPQVSSGMGRGGSLGGRWWRRPWLSACSPHRHRTLVPLRGARGREAEPLVFPVEAPAP